MVKPVPAHLTTYLKSLCALDPGMRSVVLLKLGRTIVVVVVKVTIECCENPPYALTRCNLPMQQCNSLRQEPWHYSLGKHYNKAGFLPDKDLDIFLLFTRCTCSTAAWNMFFFLFKKGKEICTYMNQYLIVFQL